MPTFFIFFILLFYAPHHLTCTPILRHYRRILHQPFFPLNAVPPSKPPSSSPQRPQPKIPFSSSSNKPPFFPSYPSPPPPPSPATFATFPANISSLILPQSNPKKPTSTKLTAIAIVLSLLSIALIAFFAFLIYRRRRRQFINNKTTGSDSHRLFPANTASSDGQNKIRGVSTTSSEFLYLGTLVNSRGIEGDPDPGSVSNGGNSSVSNSSPYRKLGSPELHPLPPLANQKFKLNRGNADVGSSGEDEEEEFYSPRGSSGDKESSVGTRSSSRRVYTAVIVENYGSRSSDSSTPSYPSSNSASPTPSISNSASPPARSSPRSLKSNSPESVPRLPAPPPPPPPTPPPPPPLLALPRMNPSPLKRKPPLSSSSSSPRMSVMEKTQQSPARIFDVSTQNQQSPTRIASISTDPVLISPIPPPPPPPPLARFWEAPNRPLLRETPVPPPVHDTISRPPVLITPSRPIVFQNPAIVSPFEVSQNSESLERNEETPKPKLKPLHWDKVRASSDRAMVWDQMKSSSFQLNEEMIETLFVVNTTNQTSKEMTRRQVLPSPNQENRVLDPKKSQNIAILLRALNVTIEEVCEGLLEGNTDTLGSELLESLLKMAPTKEEERNLKEYKDDSPFKLGPAERFLKAVIDIPFAFKRVDAMLYISNFDSEVEYLRKSFETLEAACDELRNSRMFLKLLEAVLKTGNRMNVGTNRGDAHAFKLDTLLKLVDVKGTDGKTTLLHFVVQEITRAEGSRLSNSNQNSPAGKTHQSNFREDIEYRKLGLQVVNGLSGELSNVKKAAAMDSDVLTGEVSKLAKGIGNIGEVLRMNESTGINESSRRFSESMNGFLKKAEEEIIRIQAQESVSLSLVKEITEYFHGNSAKEEAHPFRIFMVVRDFLSILDRVCKEVGKINERTVVSSARQFPVPVNPTLPPVFPIFHAQRQFSSSDDESSLSI